jgi:hypothetical protein
MSQPKTPTKIQATNQTPMPNTLEQAIAMQTAHLIEPKHPEPILAAHLIEPKHPEPILAAHLIKNPFITVLIKTIPDQRTQKIFTLEILHLLQKHPTLRAKNLYAKYHEWLLAELTEIITEPTLHMLAKQTSDYFAHTTAGDEPARSDWQTLVQDIERAFPPPSHSWLKYHVEQRNKTYQPARLITTMIRHNPQAGYYVSMEKNISLVTNSLNETFNFMDGQHEQNPSYNTQHSESLLTQHRQKSLEFIQTEITRETQKRAKP